MAETGPRIELMPIGAIAGWTRNPKLHDLPRIVESMRRFGFVAPLLLDERTGRLVAGHGRLEALTQIRKEGGEPPARISVNPDGEWCVPVLRGVHFETEAQAEAYLLADNRLSEVGGWDEAMLLESLRELSATGVDLAATGWTPEDLRTLEACMEFEQSRLQVPEADRGAGRELDESVAADVKMLKCPHCGKDIPL